MAKLRDALDKNIYKTATKAGYPSLPRIPYADILGKTPAQRLGALAPTTGTTERVPYASIIGNTTTAAPTAKGTPSVTPYVPRYGQFSGSGQDQARKTALPATGYVPTYGSALGLDKKTPTGVNAPIALYDNTRGAGAVSKDAVGPYSEALARGETPSTGFEGMDGRERYKKWYDDAVMAANAGWDSDYALLQKVYELRLQQAQEQKREALRYADILNERATVDARTAGELSRAGSGRYAEMLAGMGLTGSGYRDYIDGVSVAAERQGLQNATAERARAEREATYAEILARYDAEAEKLQGEHAADANLRQTENEARAKYLDILAGYDEKDAAEQVAKDAVAENRVSYAEALGAIGEDAGVSAKADYIANVTGDPTAGEKYREEKQTERFDGYMSYINMGEEYVNSLDWSEAVRDSKNGNISPEQFRQLQEGYSGILNVDTNLRGKNGEYLDESNAKAVVDAVCNNPMVTDKKKEEFRSEYERVYGTNQGEDAFISARNDGVFRIAKWRIGGKTVEFDYRSTGISKDIDNIMNGREEKRLVELGGKYYFRIGKTVYEATVRSDPYGVMKKRAN